MNTRLLRLISICYLWAPVVLFSATWFRSEYAYVLVVAQVAFFIHYTKNSLTENESIVSLKSLLAVGVVALIWTFLTGVGGFFIQTTDHAAHNTKFYDLFLHKWPILFPEKKTFSCYYYGYYLVPSLVFKIIGGISIGFILIYTWVGLWLGLIWLYMLLFRNILLLCLFILCGGILFSSELISLALFRFSFSYNPIWSLFFQSIYVPNQTICVLISGGIFLYYIKDYKWSFYVITLTFYWGVFPAAILAILFGARFLIDLLEKRKWPATKTLVTSYILPGILFLPTFIFLMSSKNVPVHGFYKFDTLGSLVPFIDVAVLAAIILWLSKSRPFDRSVIPLPIVVTALCMLTFLPVFRLGNFNDLFYRGMIPLFFIILVYIFQKSVTQIKKNYDRFESKKKSVFVFLCSGFFIKKYSLFLLWIALGSTAALYQITRMARYNTFLKTYTPTPYDKFPNSYQALLKTNGKTDASQYLGDPESFYFKYLSPPHRFQNQ